MRPVQNDRLSNSMRAKLQQSLNKQTGLEGASRDIGQKINKLEKSLQKLASSGANPGEIQAKENELKRAWLALESLGRIMQNRFQILMQGIRALSVR